ncbi:MAG: OB-fold domain-containing protein [Pseudomonadota bacterium]
MTNRYLGDSFLLPALDPDNKDWFTSGQLHVQFCNHCDAARYPAEDVCFQCQGSDLEFRAISGEGVIESVVEVQHPVHPLLADRVPYNVAVISLNGAPGCNAIGNIVNSDEVDVSIGQKVRAIFEEATDPESGEQLLIPNWKAI